MPSSIEWLWPPGFIGESWNPVTGCEKISPGCARCYAEVFARRFPNSASYSPNFLPGTARIVSHENRLSKPLRWKRPRFVFVNSQSDLFHEQVEYLFIAKAFEVMYRASQHIFLVLTKRADRMKEIVNAIYDRINDGTHGYDIPFPNIWLGVSAENQRFADLRIPLLIDTPAAVHFVSHEPALKQVDFGNWMEERSGINPNKAPLPAYTKEILSLSGMSLLDWIIVGGESGGKRARECVGGIEEAMRYTLAQCRGSSVAYFGKQMGSPWAKANGDKGKGENMQLWPEDLRVREWPKIMTPVV